MRVRPISPDRLVAELVARLTSAETPGRLRVAVDGPPAAEPDALAAALVDPLRAAGRPVLHVRAADFLRPASVRLEQGRTNPDAYYEGWLDEPGLRREVLDPAGPDGSGRLLPSLWDADTDRASRATYRRVPAGGVVLVSGALLLGGPLPFDVAVHLVLSPAALARRTDPAWRWTLPAFARYADEVDPASFADVVVRADDPRHPALVETG
ncbi:uridine kinase [Micromonospora sp. WMMD1128]|uniref:uridine kinase n=1 Tax=unclassified Micromonospora TaxID=2617518 RepID=UPI00248B78FC|nr:MULTISPECIES: uridine kinase [unclassified Micromonospora]WBB76797.1 uridine kinase [Micromonospora sp. WMMD1128]WFE35419.1 uridine kinase [Micromonospora sp. WMMD975]